MTDLVQALATALARLATLEEIVSRIDHLEGRVLDIVTQSDDHEDRISRAEARTLDDPEFERLLERVGTLESDVRCLETGDDLDTQIEAVVERVLDRVLEDTLDSALSGREITVTL
jgi:hypothetical protein